MYIPEGKSLNWWRLTVVAFQTLLKKRLERGAGEADARNVVQSFTVYTSNGILPDDHLA